MIENKDEILQAIEDLLDKIGWKFFIKPYEMPNRHWHLEVRPEKDDDDDNKRCFTVTIDLSVSFEDKKNHKKHMDLSEMLDFIEACLLNR